MPCLEAVASCRVALDGASFLQDPDCRGLLLMAPAFVKRRRWLTAMIQEAGRTLSGDSERQPLQVAWSHLRTTL